MHLSRPSHQRHLRLLLSSQRRNLSISNPYRNPLANRPSPPRLPEAEQRRFEELQRASTGAFSTPRPVPQTNPVPDPGNDSTKQSPARIADVNESVSSSSSSSSSLSPSPAYGSASALNARVQADGKGEELHPNVRRGAPPEFEGDVNPKTGEVGGPKNDPLRWRGDWAYNGRVTDF